MTKKHEISGADILDRDAYVEIRIDRRRAIGEIKKHRRVAVGPDATFYFESYQTMLHQVQEMLYIEGGGEAQLADELTAYNPLIPNGHELVATLMFEIDDEVRRAAFLAGLGGVEHTISLSVGEHTIEARPEDDIDRTTAAGKTSSIHFLHFPFSEAAITAMRQDGARVVLGIEHAGYAHLAILPEDVRQALVEDFD